MKKQLPRRRAYYARISADILGALNDSAIYVCASSCGVSSVHHDVGTRRQIGFAANGKGIRDVVHNWVGSFFSIATLFKRLDNEGTYIREMQVSGRSS